MSKSANFINIIIIITSMTFSGGICRHGLSGKMSLHGETG